MKVIFSEEQIQRRVCELGEEISRNYGGEQVHVIGILENGFMFLADLVRRLTCPVWLEFATMMTADSQEAGHQPLRSIGYGLEKDGLYRNLPYVADIAAQASS